MTNLSRRGLFGFALAAPMLPKALVGMKEKVVYKGFEYLPHVPAYDSNGNEFKADTFRLKFSDPAAVTYVVLDKELGNLTVNKKKFWLSEIQTHIEGSLQYFNRPRLV